MKSFPLKTKSSSPRWVSSKVMLLLLVVPLVWVTVPRQIETQPVPALSAANGDEWFSISRAYPAFRTPPASVLRDAALAWRDREGVRPKLNITGDRWTSIGPQPIGTPSLAYAGRVTTVAVHPTNPLIVYAGSNSGGIWKTTDLGNTWTPLNETLAFPAIAWIAIDPVNPSLMYAITAARTYSSRLLRSTDAGATWTESAITTNTGQTLAFAGRLFVDPARAGSANTSTIYITGFSNVLRSDDSGRTFRSVLKLANDQDFTSVTTKRAPDAPTIRDFAIDLSRPNRIFVAAAEPLCANESCTRATATMVLHRSTDSGGVWDRVVFGTTGAYTVPDRRHTEIFGPYTPRARISIAASSPDVMGIAFLDDGIQRVRVMKSANQGTTWTETSSAASTGYVWPVAFAISPTNPDEFYLASNTVIRSTNAGASWTVVGSPHADNIQLVFTAGGQLIVSNDGGIYRQTSATSFASMNNTLSITEHYAVAVHPENPLLMASGTQDNGGIHFRGALGWSLFHGGDGGDVVFDPVNLNTIYSEIEWFFDPFSGSNVFQFFRCTLNAACLLRRTGFDLTDLGPFIPKLSLDRLHPDTLWLTAERMYRTDNRAELWTASSPSIETQPRCWAAGQCANGGYFTSAAVAPTSSDTVYAGALNGDIWVTRNRGASWQSIAGTTVAPLPVRLVSDVQVDPQNPQIVYASYSGFNASGTGNGHVFRTNNGGQTWTDITGNLPDLPANALLIDPDSANGSTPRVIYVGTDIGIYKLTDDGSNTWQPFASGMPLVPVTDIVYNAASRTLIAATYGRGIWTISPRFAR
jgi:photosystem II stability/assembly factor-like uncharacterized protein